MAAGEKELSAVFQKEMPSGHVLHAWSLGHPPQPLHTRTRRGKKIEIPQIAYIYAVYKIHILTVLMGLN